MHARFSAYRKHDFFNPPLKAVIPTVPVGPPVIAAATIDPLIQTDTLPASQLAYGFDRLSYQFSGATTQWTRASDSTTQDFGFDSTGRFDKAGLIAWAGASTAYPSKFYPQMGSGSALIANVNGGTIDCYNPSGGFLVVPSIADWNGTDGSLSFNRASTGNKCLAVSISGGAYYESATSGLSPVNGLEFHMLCGTLDNRVSSGDTGYPLTYASSEHCIFSYGGSGNGIRYSNGVGINLHNVVRTASTQTFANSTWKMKKYAMCPFSLRNSNSSIDLYQYGTKPITGTPNATNITQNANLDNKALRIARGNAGYANEATAVGRIWFSGLLVTKALSNNDPLRGTIQGRLKALGAQHALITVSDILGLLGPTGALVDFRDWNAGTGLINDRVGNLSYQFNIASGTPAWTANNPTPSFGFPGLLSTGNTLDNRFLATSTYYSDRYSGTAFSFNYRNVGGDLALDFADGIDGSGGHTSFNQNDGWSLGLGWHHSQPNLYLKWSDTYQTASPDATAHTYPSQGGDSWVVQSMLKYLFNLAHGDWNDPINIGSNITCTNFYTGVTTSFTTGQLATQADIYNALGIKPPTPEQRAYSTVASEVKFLQDDSLLQFHAVTFEAPTGFDPTKTEASNGTAIVKSATNWSYISTIGFPIGQQNSSIANQIGNGNVRRADPTSRLQTMPYLSMFQGTRLLHGFSDFVLTPEQVEMLEVSLYRIFTDGYTQTDHLLVDGSGRVIDSNGNTIRI